MAGEECDPTGNGGNSTLTNQDEQEILNRVPMVPSRTESMQDSEAHGGR